MAAIRRRDTKPERALRSALHAAGLRFRVDLRLDLPGGRVRPDIVFTRRKVAVFMDGCFWHGCPEHGSRPNTRNADYWMPKINGNKARDRLANEVLAQSGWRVVRVWEHESVDAGVARVLQALAGTGSATQEPGRT